MTWNRNINEAPRDRHVILASKCGKVTHSYWVAKEARWCMFNKGEAPVAWQPWPEHPDKTDAFD
jgi:hypothetical protein